MISQSCEVFATVDCSVCTVLEDSLSRAWHALVSKAISGRPRRRLDHAHVSPMAQGARQAAGALSGAPDRRRGSDSASTACASPTSPSSDAARAGFGDRDELIAYLKPAARGRFGPRTELFRIELHYGGDGDRVGISRDDQLVGRRHCRNRPPTGPFRSQRSRGRAKHCGSSSAIRAWPPSKLAAQVKREKSDSRPTSSNSRSSA